MPKAIDSLDNDLKLHIGTIATNGTYICLVQKYNNSDYAAGLVFGYFTTKIFYQTKNAGTWQSVKEI